MNTTSSAYQHHLKGLLVEHYHEQRSAKKIHPQKAYHIQGFMEAGLLLGSIDKPTLEQLIDLAHQEVFDCPYQARHQPKVENTSLLDIPTWLRRKTG
ncbi:hypothetical protein [Thiomicrospira microaerophila]|uniref:hypothetical protein n=1 Tax=Thiomicrospira microaerophila TaxID=406020 RepID=UPI0005C8BE5B|nr:hypothetical protein [Thiomicrospira microaerophila]